MIIISNKPGQLGNLLFIYASFIAFGLESRTRILNPAFYAYKSYFTGTRRQISMYKWLYWLCYASARGMARLGWQRGPIRSVALDNGEQVEIDRCDAFKKPLCFAQGWLFRSNRLLVKHQAVVAEFFALAPRYQRRLDHFFAQAGLKDRTIIGVHIRRGDYKTFQEGRYYYSLEQYAQLLARAHLLFQNRQPVFLICSNEEVVLPPSSVQALQLAKGPGHELLDMYALARCQYILGPPSTYTMWASFAGKAPLCMVHDPNANISINDFKIFSP